MSAYELPPDWVTLRADGEGGPVVVLLDRAVASTAPYLDAPLQVAVAVQLAATADGLPGEADRPRLKELEQQLVDAAVGHARLCAVMTAEGVREWVFYGADGGWAQPFREAGVSVVAVDDPTWSGLLELAGF